MFKYKTTFQSRSKVQKKRSHGRVLRFGMICYCISIYINLPFEIFLNRQFG